MKRIPTLSLLLLTFLVGRAQDTTSTQVAEPDFTPLYKYRITLSDKKHNPFSLRHPEQFLSAKSLMRRQRQHLKLDQTDLPVTPAYVDSIRATGVDICSRSKWNNTVLVSTTDTSLIDRIAALPFVKQTRRVATYTRPEQKRQDDRFRLIRPERQQTDDNNPTNLDSLIRNYLTGSINRDIPTTPVDSIGIAAALMKELGFFSLGRQEEADTTAEEPDTIYGRAATQARQLHVEALHERGFRGRGMTIAVIDGGFFNTDTIPMLRNVSILGTKDFVTPGGNVYEGQSHGTMVLSCIGANQPGTFVGTAPEARFWLLRSEDGDSEQMVEEDNWAAAAEFADSVGADLINTSLGYSKYDNEADNVRYSELDGHARLCSHSASLLASKGIVLCNSAGNEGASTWKLISIPADADDVLTVGAVTDKGVNTSFSSLGNTADGRIKPDVVAMGDVCTVMNIDGTITTASGTSFASPILCGAVACYWQAHPQLTALEVVKAVRRLGNSTQCPDNVFGYGLPDFSK